MTLNEVRDRLLLMGFDVRPYESDNLVLYVKTVSPDNTSPWDFFFKAHLHTTAYPRYKVDTPHTAQTGHWAYFGQNLDDAWDTLITAWEAHHDRG